MKELHLLKTALFNQAVVDGEIPLRKGVIRLVDEAIYKRVPLVSEKAVFELLIRVQVVSGHGTFDGAHMVSCC